MFQEWSWRTVELVCLQVILVLGAACSSRVAPSEAVDSQFLCASEVAALPMPVRNNPAPVAAADESSDGGSEPATEEQILHRLRSDQAATRLEAVISVVASNAHSPAVRDQLCQIALAGADEESSRALVAISTLWNDERLAADIVASMLRSESYDIRLRAYFQLDVLGQSVIDIASELNERIATEDSEAELGVLAVGLSRCETLPPALHDALIQRYWSVRAPPVRVAIATALYETGACGRSVDALLADAETHAPDPAVLYGSRRTRKAQRDR